MSVTAERRIKVSKEKATRLHQLATDRGTTDEALVDKALDMLFSMTESSWQDERGMWQRAGADSLARVWDNPADARYDNWKELYGVSEG